MIPNLGRKFYFEYFKDLRWEREETSFPGNSMNEKKKGLTERAPFSIFQDFIQKTVPQQGSHSLSLVTVYPGLLIGSGYSHEVKFEGELILGFFFDHTTGLPVIPGSSVKGVLRSAFTDGPEYVAALISGLIEKDVSIADLKKLELEIFGPEVEETLERSMTSQDIFFDAFPVRSEHGGLLGEDNLTPHINREHPEMTPFSEPIPLLFLKVVPGVTFRFDFELRPSSAIPELKADLKAALFEQMLKDLGVGAKTNVGYGRWMTPSEYRSAYGVTKNTTSSPPPPPPNIPDQYVLKNAPTPYSTILLHGEIQEANAREKEQGKTANKIRFFVAQGIRLDNKRDAMLNQFQPGDWVKVKAIINDKGNQVASLANPEKIEKK